MTGRRAILIRRRRPDGDRVVRYFLPARIIVQRARDIIIYKHHTSTHERTNRVPSGNAAVAIVFTRARTMREHGILSYPDNAI